MSREDRIPENLEEFRTKEPEYDFENEAQQFLVEIGCLPTGMRPRGQLSHVKRTIAEASGGLKAGKLLDFVYEVGVWKGFRQIGIVTADEHVIFSLKRCERVLGQEIE